MTRKRRGTSFSAAELDRFLHKIAATGNQTIAAEAIGRLVRSLQARRRNDPLFAARYQAALTCFRSGTALGDALLLGGSTRALRTRGGEWVVHSHGAGGEPQLRRARAGMLTEAAQRLFLRTVAATGNLSLAASTLGIPRSTLTSFRKRDLAFDRQVMEALKEGVQRLETALLDSALRGVRGDKDDPVGDEPEPGWPALPALPRMTAAEAFAFLCKQQEQLSRPRRWHPERDRQTLKLATARLEAAMKGLKLLPPDPTDREAATAPASQQAPRARPILRRL